MFLFFVIYAIDSGTIVWEDGEGARTTGCNVQVGGLGLILTVGRFIDTHRRPQRIPDSAIALTKWKQIIYLPIHTCRNRWTTAPMSTPRAGRRRIQPGGV